jgi:type IV secretory pathway VirB3-like protein
MIDSLHLLGINLIKAVFTGKQSVIVILYSDYNMLHLIAMPLILSKRNTRLSNTTALTRHISG